jgi:hypothetical protein
VEALMASRPFDTGSRPGSIHTQDEREKERPRQDALPLDSGSSVLSRGEVERKFKAAKPGEKVTWASGREMPRGETSAYVARLYREGVANLFQPRCGAGFEFIVQKRHIQPAAERAEEDGAMERILRQLKREANLGLRCSSDAELARIAELPTRHAAAWRVTKLKKAAIIRTSVEDGPDGPWRIVTIVETKKQTLLPPALRAIRRSIREVGEEEESGAYPRRHGEGAGGVPGKRRWE